MSAREPSEVIAASRTVTPAGGSAITTRNVYDGTMMVQEQRGPGAFATYLNGARGPECRVDETQPAAETGYTVNKTTFQRGPAKWYVYDGLGSMVGEVDPSGNLTSSPKYDVYGMVRSNAGTASSRQGFVGSLGHISDTETGLIYMRARYYDPSLGRFISQDPSKNGMNWFGYCSSNCTNKVDANGMWEIPYGAELLVGGLLILLGYCFMGTLLGTILMALGVIAAFAGLIMFGADIMSPLFASTMDDKTSARVAAEISSDLSAPSSAGIAIALHILSIEAELATMDQD